MVAANTSNTGQSVLEQVGPNIIHHVSNSSKEHPIIKIPELFGIDFSNSLFFCFISRLGSYSYHCCS